MNRRTFLGKSLGAAFTSTLPLQGATSSTGQQKRPNVVFFLPDQVRRCEIGCYGGGQNAPTPNVDRLATQGTRFTNALSTYPLCTPYRAMLQTGRMPSLSGGVFNFINLPQTGQSMADVFSRAGYTTGYIGKWHLAPGDKAGSLDIQHPAKNTNPEPEFVPPGPTRMGYQHWEAYNFVVNYSHCYYYRDTPERLHMPKYETDSETDMAIEFMKNNQGSDKPFFLIVSPHPPHPGWSVDQTPADSLAATPKELHQRSNVKGWRDEPGKRPRCYYGMIRNMDDNFGRLTKFLDDSGLADNTLVVFGSDHGEMLASQSRYDKMVPYSESVDVPLILRWPGHIPAGVTSDVFYTPVDHYPTLLGLCGEKAPAIVDGKDLSWAALGQAGKGREDVLLMNFSSNWDYPQTNTTWPEWRGVKNRQHTYVRWLDGAEELYDNLADPYQERNLFDGRNASPAMVQLRQRLTDMLKEVHDDFLPGTEYATWFDAQRNVIRNGLGPVDHDRKWTATEKV